jgi:hypothetical protein
VSGGPWDTALGAQARRILERTGSVGDTVIELARKGASDDEVRELFYPRLTAIERRLLDRTVREAREDHLHRLASEYVDGINAARAKRGLGPLAAETEPPPAETVVEHRPSGPEWIAIVRAYRQAQGKPDQPLPSQDAVARAWGNRSEDTLARHLRRLGVARWHDVHALVASEP